MPVEEDLARVSPEKDMALTVGVFDGVHLGHKHLLSRLKELATEQGLLSGVVTFRQHPQSVLSPQSRLPCLTDLDERVRLLREEGIDIIVALNFTKEMAKLTTRQFISLLKKHLRMRGLVVGPDFALGRGREGNLDVLRSMGREMDFSVTVVPPLRINGEVVSSTAVRAALAAGDMEKVRALTGRPFSLHGRVVPGVHRGAKLGFPTANLDVSAEQALPPDGIYVTLAHTGDKVYPSVTNIGIRPTFGNNERTIEVYVLDYAGDLYGQELRIDIVERLRGEKKFDTEEELRKQIAEDVRRAKVIFTAQAGHR